MASAAPYVCTLDAATQKKAAEELNEDPKNRQGAIDTFRTWILQQKHFKCPTDDVFLLAFLRARKFSQLEARRQLENYLTRQEKLGEWFKDLDPGSDAMQNLIRKGPVLVLPGRDKDGRKVFIIRPGSFNVNDKNFVKKDVFRLAGVLLDHLYFCDEMTQVHGTVTIADFSKMTLAHQTKFSLDERKRFISTWQKNYPARIKAFHLYNLGPFLDFVLMVVKAAMPEKVQKRLVVHGKSLENVYKTVPKNMLPDEYLEDDYTGPSAGSEQSIIDNMIAELSKPEIRDRIKYISSKQFSIDMKDKDTDVPEASFRKLNVD